MAKLRSAPTEIEAPASTLSQNTINRAAFNTPAGVFTLGDREFPLVDLSYDSYLLFLGYLAPLIEVLVQRVAGTQGVTIPGIDLNSSMFSAANILSLCGKELPEMVLLMCKESDKDITVEEIKKLAGRPTNLVAAILQQVKQNKMVEEFSEFFKQVVSVVKPLTPAQSPNT